MHVFTKSFNRDELYPYIKRINDHYQRCISKDPDSWEDWDSRSLDISSDPIIEKAVSIIESKLKIKLICHQAQIQIWPIGVGLFFHKHQQDVNGRYQSSLYNSMLYLNDDFFGGEFVTEEGIKIEPKIGTLTLFNGNDILHGVSPYYGNHRYTIIFWWDRKSHWI